MGIPSNLFFTCCAFACIAWAQDPREIVRKSVSIDNDYNKRAEDYTMAQKTVEKVLGSDGRVKSTSSKTKDIFFIRGERYNRLIEKDGKPLPPGEEKKEREQFEKRLAERNREPEAQLKKRLAEREKRRKHDREFLQEIPDAFTFKLLPDEKIDGRAVWAIEASPRPDYKPRASEAKNLTKFRGKLWIDKADYAWVKMECESMETFSFGFLIARLSKGAHFIMEQTRLSDDLWLPKRIQIRYDARIALLKHQTGEVEQTMCNFKKFQTDSRILSVTEQ
jgi:hypothetical protein